MKRIGYLYDNFTYERNIIRGLPGFEYIKTFDIFKVKYIISKILLKMGIKVKGEKINFYYNSFKNVRKKVDLYHFFNTISYGDTAWISTFETMIPRYSSTMQHQKGIILNKELEVAINQLFNENCKKLIALSQNAYDFQVNLLSNYPEKKDKIMNKMCVLHPPQQVFTSHFGEKQMKLDGKVSYIFVGRDFFRKGGKEILKAFLYLKSFNKYDFELTIISSLNYNDYATNSSFKDLDMVKKIIEENSDWINFYESLPNQAVINLMKKHHVGLLPTWAETYGYSLLEMQACGCPVISTDVRAIPEINNNKTGWIIDTPKNELGEAYYNTVKDKELLSHIIYNQLIEIITEIQENPKLIEEKSIKSIERIKKNHDPRIFNEKLLGYYYEILK